MQVSTNINALISSNALSKSNASIADSVQRLSTGQKLAKDDPSAVGMGSRLKSQLSALSAVNKGLNLGVGALQQMDSSLTEVQNILQNMYQLAVSNSADDSVITTADRTANSTAFTAYSAQLTALSKMPKLGTTQLLSGTAGTITMKANDSTDNITAATYSMASLTSLALFSSTAGSAATTATAVKADIDTVSGYQAQVGANLESLTSLSSANNAVMTGLTSAYSTVTSSDMASEVSKLASAQIRQSASSAMFAQSNQMDREVAAYLLKGL
jgi:flagellin